MRLRQRVDPRGAVSDPLESRFAPHGRAAEFKPIRTFTVEEMFGNWQKAQQTHFSDGGTFDQIIVDRK